MRLAEKEPTPRLIDLKTILFATDFSPSSTAPLPYVAAIARQYEAKVYLAHVVMPESHSFVTPDLVAYAREQTDRDAQLRLLICRKSLEEFGTNPSWVTVRSPKL